MLARIRKSLDEKEEGFTLIELLVVIIIIGILAAIAIPVFLSQRKKGYDAQAKADLKNIATSEESYLTENPTSGYLACTGAAACVGTGSLGAQGLKLSSGDQVAVSPDTSGATKGFCAVALSASGNYWVYDSENGGLQATSTSTLPTWTTGACSGQTSAVTPAA